MKLMNKAFLALLFVSAPAFAVEASAPSDAQITKIIETANAGEIDAAQIAKSRAKNPEVLKFAKEMVAAHATTKKDLADLAKKQKINPVTSDRSNQIADGTKHTLVQLKTAKDAEFDRTYMQSQVEAHQSLLESLDNELIDGAKDLQLKEYLQKARADVSSHLDEAKEIQLKL